MPSAPSTPPRQSSGNLTLLGTSERSIVRDGKPYTERKALLKCACGAEFSLSLSRWQTQPPQNCQKCAIRKAKKAGWHGFRARKKAPQALDTLK